MAVAIAAVAAFIGSDLVSSPDAAKPTKSKSQGFVRFSDPQAGFSIAYPRSWRRLPADDVQVRLIAAGAEASLLVRATPLGTRVRRQDLKSAKELSDKLVKSVKNVQLLRKPRQVESGGLAGYLYLYTFTDRATGKRGAHAHYFLFRDRTMLTLVFQTVPTTSFAGLAPLFDRIANTFQAEAAPPAGQR